MVAASQRPAESLTTSIPVDNLVGASAPVAERVEQVTGAVRAAQSVASSPRLPSPDSVRNLVAPLANAPAAAVPEGARSTFETASRVASTVAEKAQTVRSVVETGRQVVETVQGWFSSDGGETLPEVQYALFVEGEESPWQVHQLRLREALNALYELTLDLAIEDLTADPDELLEARCCLEVSRGTLLERRYGEVRRVQRLGVTNTRRLARVTLGPALQRLAQAADVRIFQGLSAPEIIAAVLDGHRLYQSTLALELDREHPAREYCVQYHESDLAFVTRLLEEEGITLAFRHEESDDGEQLVLTDHARGLPAVPTLDGEPAPVAGPESATLRVESIRYFDVSIETRSTGATVRDFDWTRPTFDLTQSHPSDPGARPVYEYPAELTIGGYQPPSYGEYDHADQARLRHEARVGSARVATARTNLIGAKPGAVLTVAGHGDAGHDGDYVVLRAEHTGYASEAIAGATQHDQGDRERYRNELVCAPREVSVRPERRTPKPRVYGMQTATVVGPAGEEIYTDVHGRVKVQFHWDRVGQRDEHSSCWVRVMQTWAGPGWGTFFLPRIGMEVVVNFLEGNPDRPLVVGCVYNGVNHPPYTLPDEKTKSTIKTRSSVEGEGSNELRFEDLKGSEEVYLHAQKDLNEVVENNHTTTVHANQTNSVGGNQTESVGRDQSMTVKGKRTKTVKKDEEVKVEGARTTTVTKLEKVSLLDARETEVTLGDKLTVKQTYAEEITGKTTGTYHGGREVTVEKFDNITVNGANKNTTVHGQYNVIADTHFKVKQGGDELLIENAVLLKSAGKIQIQGPQDAVVLDGGKVTVKAASELVLSCGAASITLKSDGTVTIAGSKAVELGAGSTAVKLEPAGLTNSGPKISSGAIGMHEITGAVVKIN